MGTLLSEVQAFSLDSAAVLRQMDVWWYAERLRPVTFFEDL